MAADAGPPGHLPRPRTSFVGRAAELAQARRLLAQSRLLTLTGPGGCGKTRLSIELATRARADFPDGVHFVSLAAIRDPALVPVAVAQGMGLQDSRGGRLLEHLTDYLLARTLLLILDNFEHVLAAAGFVDALLAEGGDLRVLVTSRSPLHLSGEQEFPVPPLPLPDRACSAAAIPSAESVQLFGVRAAAAVPGFTVDDGNAEAVAGIVARLDGLPLAIELAAARVKLLPPAEILARLEHSLALLVSGGRDVPDRQRTLRGAIAWSYELLSEEARRLLAASSVFRGGIGLADIEAIGTSALGAPVLDALQELVDHSLLRLSASSVTAPRYMMLETVREFAAEQLRALPEAAAVHAAHAARFWQLAEELDPPPFWPARDGLDALEHEHDNFRAALDWFRRADPAMALRLANRLTAFWSARGHFSEGRRRLGELLDMRDGAVTGSDTERVRALNGAAWLATDQGDHTAAEALFERSIACARAMHDAVAEATALFFRGRGRLVVGDFAAGRSDIARALQLQTAAGDDAGAAAATWFAGLSHSAQGEVEAAAARFERSAELSERLGLPAVEARALQLLGLCRVELGDLPGARAVLAKGVPAVADIGDRFAVPAGLTALAGLAAKGGRPRAALMLAGAVVEYERVNETYRPAVIRTYLDRWLADARTALGAAAAGLIDKGRRLTLDEAIALGFDDRPEGSRRTGSAPELTRREAEVAMLVARGLTNREVAGQLYLSVRTVEVHVDRILTKLGFRTRTQLAAWAHEEGLLSQDT